MTQPNYYELMARLDRARKDLGGLASTRSLGRKLGFSPTTVTKWLAGQAFPQHVDSLVALVAAIRDAAQRNSRLTPELDALTTRRPWDIAYLAETRARATDTADAVARGAARQTLAATRPGLPVDQCDPLRLGVKPAIDGGADGPTGLPRYVRRAHDVPLGKAVADGQVITLIGGSSTGKSRSAWEAIQTLDPSWRVWRPGDWGELDRIEPHTVVWLDEPQTQLTEENSRYLGAVVSDTARAPVTLIAQMWHEVWRTLDDGEHPEAARLLLAGQVIPIPAEFNPLDPAEWAAAAAADPRLARAAYEAGMEVTQYLAGVPALIDVYQHGQPMTRALITAAVDARRLGLPAPLPLDFLAEAATGYPTDAEWQQVHDQDWLPAALAEASKPVRGLPGPLRPDIPRTRTRSVSTDVRLALYLEEYGSIQRRTEIPKAAFWDAAHRFGTPEQQATLATRADGFGLYRIGASLRKAALSAGHPAGPAALLEHVPDAGDDVIAWIVEHTPVIDLRQLEDLDRELARRDEPQARAALHRRAAQAASLADPEIVRLVRWLATSDDNAATADFLARRPALAMPTNVNLLGPLAQVDHAEAEIFAKRMLTENSRHLAWFVHPMVAAGFRHTIRAHLLALPAGEEPDEIVRVLEVLHDNNFPDEVRYLLERTDPADLSFDHLRDAARVLQMLADLAMTDQLTAVIAMVNQDSRLRRWSPNREAMLANLPLDVSSRLRLDPEPQPPAPRPPRSSINLSPYTRAEDVAEAFATEMGNLTLAAADKAAQSADMANLERLLALLWHLRAGGQHDARDTLVERIEPNLLPSRTEKLCALARELGPSAAAKAVMTKVVAECDPWYSKSIRRVVLSALEAIGATDLIARLAWRIADAGNFAACTTLLPHVVRQYPYGRDPNREPSFRWSWSDLA
ncbi:hypothetical protein [Amycolatopsis sp. lyj-112]|uniref:hypothetical protein n=1 Tax=Amycolatopsis sp. lyj-112 TaxID=2789288 RepID=UPI00397A6B89